MIDAATADVRQTTLVPGDLHLRGGHNAGSERPGHGVYRQYNQPVDRGKESEIRLRLDELRARRKSADH